jgi:predicted SAM-dependent methyltransferase
MTREQTGMKLHIGGWQTREGWKILDILPRDGVDYLGNCLDLGQFADDSLDEIYASHVLEHLDYKTEVEPALREWRRALKPGGIARISVPDLDILSRLFVHPQTKPQDRFQIMRMMFGGHADAHDQHKTGFFFDMLGSMLDKAGFVGIKRVERFGLFSDSSEIRFAGNLISLNLEARKPG